MDCGASLICDTTPVKFSPADQRGLAGAVRPEQREDLAALDAEGDGLERLEPGVVGLRQIIDGNDRWHE